MAPTLSRVRPWASVGTKFWVVLCLLVVSVLAVGWVGARAQHDLGQGQVVAAPAASDDSAGRASEASPVGAGVPMAESPTG